MAMTGFNPDEVNSSINSVKSAYEALIRALGDDMQNQFVGGMADKWACRNAQSFFNDAFKPSVDSLISSSNQIFESIGSAMNAAGQAWAEQTDANYSPVSFSVINKTMDTSVIQENIGGVRGIDLDTATGVVAKLPTIAESAKNALTQAQQAVQSCGFIGGGQAESLVNALGVVKSKIDAATGEISNETKSYMDQTIAEYSNTEGKVSEAFSANN